MGKHLLKKKIKYISTIYLLRVQGMALRALSISAREELENVKILYTNYTLTLIIQH